MTRKFAANLLAKSHDFIQYEIVEGHFILLDSEDFEIVRERRWYLSVEKKCNSTHFITNIKLGHKRYQKITLQSFLLRNRPSTIAKLINKSLPLDYRKANLTLVSSREQSQSFGKRKGRYSSIYKGVSYRNEREKWAAMIKCPDGKQKLIGYFDDENDAALAYNEAAKNLFGDHAFQNEAEPQKKSSKHLRSVTNRFSKPQNKRIYK